MAHLIDPHGQPTEELKQVVNASVGSMLKFHKSLPENQRVEFVAVAAQSPSGEISYWGIIDLVQTPEEDMYLEIFRRYYCALRTRGESEIACLSLVPLGAVVERKVAFDINSIK